MGRGWRSRFRMTALTSHLRGQRTSFSPWRLWYVRSPQAVVLGLWPQYHVDCLKSVESAANAGILDSLLTLVIAVKAGSLQPRAAPFLCAAHLIQLKKKDGGARPIAVGDTLRRLVVKWLLATSQGRITSSDLAPLPTDFAQDYHCEVVAMEVQAQTDTLNWGTGWLLLQVDLKNAFNSIHRPSILDVHAAVGTSGLPARALARGPRGHPVDPGVQQGDPLVLLLFAAGIQGGPGRPAAGRGLSPLVPRRRGGDGLGG